MANEIYDSTWWGNTIQTASSIGTSTEMIQGQFNLTKLGDDLVTNGSFDTDSNWNGVNTNGVTISNGSLNFSETTISHNITQSNVVEIGKNYKVTLTISNYIKGSVLVVLGAGGITQEISANGTFTLYGVASINIILYIQARGASNTTLSIDNISVKEVRATTVEASKCLADAIHRIGIQDIQN